jgi:hypothetical protein
MEFIGEIERAFAAAIYPNRALIAIITVAGFVTIGVIAWRRRWDLMVRRHRRVAVITAVIAIVFIAPAAVYLGAPLFVSTTIDEPPPAAAAEPSPAGATLAPGLRSSTPIPAARASPDPTPSSTPPPPVERVGNFTGADEFHFGRGTARLIETAPESFTVRLESFEVRNGPDLYVYLSPDPAGYVDGAVELGRLKADRGNQNYEVPAGTDVTGPASVVIWCKQFSVVFATAPLT